jgi:hypothetical protein
MSAYSGPEVVGDGLVFYYDMGNPQKSWKGAPTTNIWAYSRAFSNWNKTAPVTVTDNSVLSPNGDLSASTISANGSGLSNINISGTVTSGNTYTKSVYAKAGTTSILVFESYDNNGSGGVAYFPTTFNLTLGTFSAAVGDTATMTYITNGWYRCSVTRSYTLTTGSGTFYIGAYGFGTGSLYLWDAQFELGSLTPVVATNGASASRSNTQAILDLTNNNIITATSPTYNSNGTFSFSGGTERLDIPATIGPITNNFSISAWVNSTNISATQNIVSMNGPYFMRIDGSKVRFNVFAGGTWLFQNGTTTLSSNTWYYFTMVYNYDSSLWIGYINGVQEFSVAKTGTIASSTFFAYVGYTPQGGEQSNFLGQIAAVQYYNRALSAAEVQQNFNALRGRYGL